MRSWSQANSGIEFIITNPKALSLIAAEPTQSEISKASELLLLHAMPATVEAFNSRRLTSLLPVRHGRLIVTCGRLGEKPLQKLLGVSYLPILMPHTRVAYLYMVTSHMRESGLSDLSVEHHRSAVGTLARSRTYVWITRGKALAKKVVSQ